VFFLHGVAAVWWSGVKSQAVWWRSCSWMNSKSPESKIFASIKNAKSASNEGSFLYSHSKYMKEKRDDYSIVKCMNFNCTTVLTHTYFLPYTAINHADVAAVLHPIMDLRRKSEIAKIGWQRHDTTPTRSLPWKDRVVTSTQLQITHNNIRTRTVVAR